MKAHTRHIRISQLKLNTIAGTVRGMRAEEALAQLKFMPKKAAHVLYKTIASAVANAESTHSQNRRDLMIEKILIQRGSYLRRGRPGPRGRWKPRRKPLSHIYVELGLSTPAPKSTPKTQTPAATAKPAQKAEEKSEKKSAKSTS